MRTTESEKKSAQRTEKTDKGTGEENNQSETTVDLNNDNNPVTEEVSNSVNYVNRAEKWDTSKSYETCDAKMMEEDTLSEISDGSQVIEDAYAIDKINDFLDTTCAEGGVTCLPSPWRQGYWE